MRICTVRETSMWRSASSYIGAAIRLQRAHRCSAVTSSCMLLLLERRSLGRIRTSLLASVIRYTLHLTHRGLFLQSWRLLLLRVAGAALAMELHLRTPLRSASTTTIWTGHLLEMLAVTPVDVYYRPS